MRRKTWSYWLILSQGAECVACRWPTQLCLWRITPEPLTGHLTLPAFARMLTPYLLWWWCCPSLRLLLFWVPLLLPKIGRTFDWHAWEANLPDSCPLLACVYQIALQQHSGNWNEGRPRQGQWEGLHGGQSNINVGSVKGTPVVTKETSGVREEEEPLGPQHRRAPPPRHTGRCGDVYSAISGQARGALHGIMETCLLRSVLLDLHPTWKHTCTCARTHAHTENLVASLSLETRSQYVDHEPILAWN